MTPVRPAATTRPCWTAAVPGDGVVAKAGGGGDQRFGQGGAVPAALGQQRSAGACLDAELVGAVVHDRHVAQRAGGEVEPLWQGLGVGAVVAEPPGFVAAGGGRGQDPGAGAAGILAGPGDGQADGQVRAAGRGAGRAGGGGDRGFQRPGDLPQRLAFVVLALAVVAFADVPAAVGIAGAQPGALGRSSYRTGRPGQGGVGARYRQDLPYGSPAWHARYATLRNTIGTARAARGRSRCLPAACTSPPRLPREAECRSCGTTTPSPSFRDKLILNC